MWRSLIDHTWRHNMAHTSCMPDKQDYMHAHAYIHAPGYPQARTHAQAHTDKYVIRIAFPQQKWFANAFRCLAISRFCIKTCAIFPFSVKIFTKAKLSLWNAGLRYLNIISVDFWDLTPWNLVDECQRFGAACCLHCQGRWLISCNSILEVCFSETLAPQPKDKLSIPRRTLLLTYIMYGMLWDNPLNILNCFHRFPARLPTTPREKYRGRQKDGSWWVRNFT
jgi:hypothetical protein